MSLQFITGNSGNGKTKYLFNRIVKEAKANPRDNYLVIVPEQFTMQTQRQLVDLSENKAIMNIDVLSFKRLAYRVFDELGITRLMVLEETGKNLVLRKLAGQEADKLGVIGRNLNRIGYISEVKSLLSELVQYNISPQDLEGYIASGRLSDTLSGKLKDVLVLYEAFEKLNTYQWIIFTSPAGVEIFFDEMDRKEMDVRSLGQAKIAVIGEGTKKKLKEHHLLADFVPSVYDGDTLGAELAKELQGNEKILIPRAEAGNKKLTELLEQTGAQVDDIATYTTRYEKSRLIDEKKELETGSVDCVVFTSASTVKGFVEGTQGLDYTKVKAACIGKQTKAAADAYGMQTRMAKKATIESLIELVEEMKQEN